MTKEKLTRAGAIKRYIESGDDGRQVKAAEMLAFKKVCTSEEWVQFANDAADILDVEIEAK